MNIETKHWLEVYDEQTAFANEESIRGSNINILITKKQLRLNIRSNDSV